MKPSDNFIFIKTGKKIVYNLVSIEKLLDWFFCSKKSQVIRKQEGRIVTDPVQRT
jgi:hypothetical protein